MKAIGAIGQLSFIFPGPGQYPKVPVDADDGVIQSRVCEQVWLEPDLFDGNKNTEIIALFEEFYPVLKVLFGRNIPPGSLGEQLVIRGVDPSLLTTDTRVIIGDAAFKVVNAPDLEINPNLMSASPAEIMRDLPYCGLVLIEQGLAEPGAPVVIQQDVDNRELTNGS